MHCTEEMVEYQEVNDAYIQHSAKGAEATSNSEK